MTTSSTGPAAAPQSATTTASASPAVRSPVVAVPGADEAGIVWLCMPGAAHDPCEQTLTTTVIDAAGKRQVESLAPGANPPVDCFYVYPTTSHQPTTNADLSIDPELVTIATWQAAPFSQVCRVYAPVYPQLTIAALNGGMITTDAMMKAYAGVVAAFSDYLKTYNHGRGVVLIGHSQGAMDLVSLLQDIVESQPDVRKLLVSALLMGGSATTAPGKAVGGDFADLPTCSSATQTGCVVGYSSFGQTPPDNAVFARPDSALGLLRRPQSGEQMMCVNPAALNGRATFQMPLVASSDLPRLTAHPPSPLPTTVFVSYPDAYAARCQQSGTAAWLEVTPVDPSGPAPVMTGTEGPTWGMHDLDVSLPLGDLVDLVRAESAAYVK